ncbi:hypothetical protein [Pseudolactococcus insecticola]|uniref:Uncharacterized protein n=1 Tax=Pseudolactococcus insecticola TaxID=2709158 RepID=A0A6A0B425_9LACT|nr:hypothetical protein [Lactococcus insecticola]GFH39796.1 hypothetical protein Hs20B_01940 [Lactococcus insecticola]
MTDKETLFTKLKGVGSPLFLLNMTNDARKFLNQHQVDFPQTNDFDRVYLIVSDQAFEVYEGGVSPLEVAPEKGSLIRLTQESLEKIVKKIDLNIKLSEIVNHDELTQLLNELKKGKSIKQYKKILSAIDNSFETNLKMGDFFKIAIKQLG